MYSKLLQQQRFIFDKLEEIQNSVNKPDFLNFKDAFLETALDNCYWATVDLDCKQLYKMYLNRIRSKVIYEIKDLYETDDNLH